MSNTQFALPISGIRDNLDRGTVGQFLQEKIKDGSKLSIVSAYFTINAIMRIPLFHWVDFPSVPNLGPCFPRLTPGSALCLMTG
jgi:hypothetical protein